jgi:hypothetical protein
VLITRFVAVFFILGLALPVFAQKKEQDRIKNSGVVVNETLGTKSRARKGVAKPAASAQQAGEFYVKRVPLQQMTSLPRERTQP